MDPSVALLGGPWTCCAESMRRMSAVAPLRFVTPPAIPKGYLCVHTYASHISGLSKTPGYPLEQGRHPTSEDFLYLAGAQCRCPMPIRPDTHDSTRHESCGNSCPVPQRSAPASDIRYLIRFCTSPDLNGAWRVEIHASSARASTQLNGAQQSSAQLCLISSSNRIGGKVAATRRAARALPDARQNHARTHAMNFSLPRGAAASVHAGMQKTGGTG